MTKKIVVLFICILTLVGCSNITNHGDSKDYISFTVTKDENSELNMYIYTYEIASKKLECKKMIPYESQYPLGVYDSKTNNIYYSKRNDGKRDELYAVNLDTNEIDQLTNDLFAINYIIPLDKQILIAAVKQGERAVGFYSYNEGKLSRVFTDKDEFISQLSFNPDLNKLVFSSYSKAELDKEIQKNDGSGIVSNSIFVLDLSSEKIKKILEVESQDVSMVNLNSENEVFYKTDSVYQYSGTISEATQINDLDIGEMIYYDKKDLYYINKNRTKMIKYNLSEKKDYIIYQTDIQKAAINNATVLKNN